ncbi:MAG: hypothetical protein ACT4QG_03775 [Sporichthyaceae bacterium]
MTSPIEAPSDEVQEELNGLLNVALEVAADQLSTVGEFYPFAVALGLDEEVRLVAPDMGGEEHPDSEMVLARCFEALASAHGDVRAAAVTADVWLNEADTDAVRVDLEHVDGLALRILLPYSKSADGELAFGELIAEQGDRAVWT